MPRQPAEPAVDLSRAQMRQAAPGVGGGEPAKLAPNVRHVIARHSHGLPVRREVFDQFGERLGDDIAGVVVREKLHGLEERAPAELRVRLGEDLRADV